MSIDFQLAHSCPHVTIEEIATLQSDRRSLLLRQPIASSKNVRITVNNGVTIPQNGLHASALLRSFQPGPFRVIKNENQLGIRNGQGEVSILLPVGSRVPTDEIIRIVQKELDGEGIAVRASQENGYLTFEDQYEKGTASFVYCSGSALSSLGLDRQKAAKGKEVYPAWTIDERLDVVPITSHGIKNYSRRFPKFVKPLKGNPVIKVSYATFREKCLRCLRTGVENDYRIARDGNFLLVANENLLYQQAMKMILTVRGSNPFHPEYGSLLTTRIGSKVLADTQGILQMDVITCLERLKGLQRMQAKYQVVSPRERLQSIQGVSVIQSPDDPTAFGIQGVIRNASNEPISLSLLFAVTGSVALTNSRGESLGAFGSIANLTSVVE